MLAVAAGRAAAGRLMMGLLGKEMRLLSLGGLDGLLSHLPDEAAASRGPCGSARRPLPLLLLLLVELPHNVLVFLYS